VEFRILGSLEAGTAAGDQLRLGRPSEQKVLAVLLLNAGHLVPVASLVDVLWDDNPPATAVRQAQNAVGRLRRLLSRGGEPDAIVTELRGYKIGIDRHTLDARLFEAKAIMAEEAVSAGEVAKAAVLLDSALGLWRGPALAGLRGKVIEAAAEAWNERRCTVQELFYDCRLALGEHRQLVGDLRVLVSAHPLRERPVSLLMLALHRCGRQAEALATYRDTRDLLARELGVDPTHDLQRLHQQILTGDQALEIPASSSGPDGHAATAALQGSVPRQLPGAPRDFTGRRDVLQTLDRLLDEQANSGGMVLISAIGGTAGVGKTALAVHFAHRVAERFPEGQLYVNLRGFDPSGPPVTPSEAIRGFLDALEVPAPRIPPDLTAQVGLYRSLLAGRRVLIVADNARDAAQVRPLLPGSPGCLVLVTSRGQLPSLVAADGAHPIELDVLSPDEASELLAARLGPGRAAAEPEAVASLVTLCAQLPLALTIAAARVAAHPSFPLSAVAAEFRDGPLDALAEGSDPAANMRAVFSWSYHALTPAAAQLFRLLGLHPGPDTSALAAASLAGLPPPETRILLAELAAAHLIGEHLPGRFACHDLLRAYAHQLAEVEDSDAQRQAAIDRLLDHYEHSAHAAQRQLSPSALPMELNPALPGVTPEEPAGHARALAWFVTEHAVLLAALEYAARKALDMHVWRMARALWTFLDWQVHWHEQVAVQSLALAAAQRLGDIELQARGHHLLASASARLGLDDAPTHMRQALDLYRECGSQAGQANTLLGLAIMGDASGHHAEALDHSRQALELYQVMDDSRGITRALNAVGWCHAQLGDYQQSIVHCQQAIALHEAIDDRHGQATTLHSLGYAHHRLGQHDEAIACYRRALNLFRDMGDRRYEADTLTRLGDTYDTASDHGAAREAWQEALTILDELDQPDAAKVRSKLSALHARAGR
jgi:DNA-binding SARP family transcriptional activator/tetratricopeptide (TPR) repeat protein